MHAGNDRFAIGRRTRAMEAVGGLAAPFHDAEDFGAAGAGVGEALENQRAGTLRHDKAVAVARKRPGGRFGRIISGG
jgi:hypothetical protein